jgi:hypothetical protein
LPPDLQRKVLRFTIQINTVQPPSMCRQMTSGSSTASGRMEASAALPHPAPPAAAACWRSATTAPAPIPSRRPSRERPAGASDEATSPR